MMDMYLALLMLSSAAIVVVFLLYGEPYSVDLCITSSGNFYLSFGGVVDPQNSLFILTVLIISSMVIWYSFSYMSDEVFVKRFLTILSLFSGCMCILIVSSNLFSSLIGWDGLGVTSLYLILYYYSKSAFKASTLTFLMNRVGDCFLILALAQIILTGGTMLLYPCTELKGIVAFLLILTSITKSAQIPFSTWLPAAMEAPTPVSALVHSSTLVTAGIYLLFRYSEIWVSSSVKDVLMVLSISTCFMAALSALVESDLKKLIALSTLSQLGFIMFSFSLGLLSQGYTHMLMHAFFKALLFMCAGLMIHSFKGSQSIQDISISARENPLLMVLMSLSLMSMSGLPFLSGFYSKDVIIDSLKDSEWSILVLVLLVASFVCTALYSVRMIWYLTTSSSNWHCMSASDYGMVKPMIPLALLASVGGSCISWLMLEPQAFTESSKIPILILLVMSVAVYWKWDSLSTSSFLESKWNLSTFNLMISNMAFRTSKFYSISSDLVGVPEVINLSIKEGFHLLSDKLSTTMVHYSNNQELLLFLLLAMLMFI